MNDPLREYYTKAFPVEMMYKWISYGSDEYFEKREWSFTKNDIYTRYNCWSNQNAFRESVIGKSPDKMDIGPVYSTAPSNRAKVGVFVAKEKELVFDIDATDYAEVFVTTEKTDFITSLTWPLMSIAIKVLDDILRNDFGFEHILFVFSGRRGIHAWVCDKKARVLNNQARAAIADYLQIVVMNDHQTKKVKLKKELHPSLRRVYFNILKPEFERYFIEEQQLLCDEKHIGRILQLVSEDVRQKAQAYWKKELTSQGRWDILVELVDNEVKNIKGWLPDNPIFEIVFTYTYPRLDINLSKQLNHLLKSPFVIHPGSGRVCVPVDPENCESFRPEDVPQLKPLVEELNQTGDVKKTSMNQYLNLFTKFVSNLQNDVENMATETQGDTFVDDFV